MKANYFDINGKKTKSIELPKQFDEPVRFDLIHKAVLSVQCSRRQSYGAKPDAGQRASAVLSRRRRKFRGSYGHGISRVPRKILWKRGTQFGWVGAFAPGTVGGRRAHPPKASKDWTKKINIKERRKAIRSALAAVVNEEIVKERGHKFKELPTVIDSKIETFTKTKQVKELLLKMGLDKELERASIKKVRAGRGKSRGRKYKKKVGPLIVVSKSCPLNKSGINLPGVTISTVKTLNAELLAPGTIPGRLTIFSEDAIKLLDKNKLFTNNPVKEVKK
jgi:large subunit ribosomal protein L4e